MARYSYGGQALVEGVLMRGRDAIAVAMRHPDGRIVWAAEPLQSGFRGSRVAKLPFVRGLVVLYETLIVGSRWLVRSALKTRGWLSGWLPSRTKPRLRTEMGHPSYPAGYEIESLGPGDNATQTPVVGQ